MWLLLAYTFIIASALCLFAAIYTLYKDVKISSISLIDIIVETYINYHYRDYERDVIKREVERRDFQE